MIHALVSFPWYLYAGFVCFAVGVGIFADAYAHRKPKKEKPLGRHARRTDMETTTYELSEDWKYVVAVPREDVRLMTEMPPVPTP